MMDDGVVEMESSSLGSERGCFFPGVLKTQGRYL